MNETGYQSAENQYKGLQFLIEHRLDELGAQYDGAATNGTSGAHHDSAFQWLLMGESVDDRLDALAPLLEELPAREAGRAWKPLSQRIGIIADEFFYRSFDGLADFVVITPKNYSQHVDNVDLLLVVSTWKGVNGTSWTGLANPKSSRRRLLIEELIPAFRAAEVPVVFCSKEDPPNYERFLPLAQECDIVFTSAVEKVPDYVRDCPRAARVDVLKFGVNPRHHSPIGSRPGRNDMTYFAGAWLPQKYSSRTNEANRLLRGVLQANRKLALIDRHYAYDGKDPRYAYPAEYTKFLGHARPHDYLMQLQRITDYGLNFNSVVASQTMFANRVLELQAAGAVVFSTYNQGVNSDYPQVYIATTKDDVTAAMNVMSFAEMRRAQADGIRKVFSADHAQLRVDKLVEAAGFEVPDRTLRVVAVADEPTGELMAEMDDQSLGPVRIVSTAELADVEADVVLPLSPDFSYGVHYAKDMVTAFTYTNADVVAKSPEGLEAADAVSHRYLDGHQHLGTTAWWTGVDGADSRAALRDSLQQQLVLQGELKLYGLDGFAVEPRTDGATAPKRLRSKLQMSVVVPIYNNGDHLRHKAFASLQRSSIFDKMHILLIDDGSTDPSTRETVRELERNHPNVTAFMFPTGGSGSASRPRNKGLEMADTEFVTYLDPDDEMINDGYARLFKKLKQHPDAEFVVGDMLRLDKGRGNTTQARRLMSKIPMVDGLLRPDRDSLSKLSYQPASIEAIAARTEWLKGLGIEQPVGAVGQDTFFFQQMLFYATKIAVVKKNVYAYYAAVSGSVVNVVSAKYFRKYLPLESARAAWLKEVGLLENYNERRLEPFFKQWYMRKLGRVAPEDYAESVRLIREIVGFYEPKGWSDPEVVQFWQELDERADNSAI
ncbi:hypothetical protein BJH93_09135 [Kocuria polaris]|nr:hypothetical protein [Kocuria polaris]